MIVFARVMFLGSVLFGVYTGTRWGLACAAVSAVMALLPPMQVKK